MHNDNPQADNLFSRLLSYVPSPERIPLEDYCTESLAWCLLHASKFRRDFFGLVYANTAKAQKLAVCESPDNGIRVHTQFGFSPADDDGEAVTKAKEGRRRFDLVIHSAADSNFNFVVIVESKVQWSFTENQIPAYQVALEKWKRFEKYEHKYLVLLSPSGSRPDIADHPIPVIPMSWSTVHQLLVEFSGTVHLRSENQSNLPAVQFVCAQFATFLVDAGLAPMKIPKTSLERIEGIELRERLAKMLLDLRPEGNKRKFKKDVLFEEDDDGKTWLGLYGSDSEEFNYVGFKLRGENGSLDFRMYIQVANNPQIEKNLMPLQGGLVENGKYAVFEQVITGEPKFDGNTLGIRKWFEEKLHAISKSQLKR
jgi:hypothetical protein